MKASRFLGRIMGIAGGTPARANVAVRAVESGQFNVVSSYRHKPAKLLTTLIFLLMAVSVNSPALAEQVVSETDRKLEYKVKLAYLCNLGRYVDWPDNVSPNNSETLVIGILGEDPFDGIIDEIVAGRKVHGRKIEVRRFALLEEYRPCHILFVPNTVSAEKRKAAIEKLQGKPVILVGESAGFAADGGCVNFYREGDNVRLEINPDSLENQFLKASAKLLSLAKIVK